MKDDRSKTTVTRPEDLVFRNPDGSIAQIPVEGSLALLATGYKGLLAWRAARQRAAREKNANENTPR